MAYEITCDTPVVDAVISGSTVAGVPQCNSGWIVTEVVPSDFAQLVELLSFDVGVFSTLLGSCVLFFLIGHYAGHVARNLGRL